ncbi:hypothetical protein Q4S05_10605 [Morganella morganii]|nr:hypothetical protein [Morganella morganii]
MTKLTVISNALPAEGQPTMTSLEMVDYINADRKAKAESVGSGGIGVPRGNTKLTRGML